MSHFGLPLILFQAGVVIDEVTGSINFPFGRFSPSATAFPRTFSIPFPSGVKLQDIVFRTTSGSGASVFDGNTTTIHYDDVTGTQEIRAPSNASLFVYFVLSPNITIATRDFIVRASNNIDAADGTILYRNEASILNTDNYYPTIPIILPPDKYFTITNDTASSFFSILDTVTIEYPTD